jgi:hypothetical protein
MQHASIFCHWHSPRHHLPLASLLVTEWMQNELTCQAYKCLKTSWQQDIVLIFILGRELWASHGVLNH